MPNRKERRSGYAAAKRAQKKNIDQIRKKLYCPNILSFEINPVETREFFFSLRKLIDQNNNLLVELSTLRDIDLGAALVLVAEFDRWQRKSCTLLSPKTIEDWDPNIVKKLSSLGFFKILKTVINKKIIESDDKFLIQFISDTLTIGKAAVLLKKKIISIIDNSKNQNTRAYPIYAPLVESMKNAIQHGYPDDISWEGKKFFSEKRWWMAAELDKENQRIQIAFLDLGITIPGTLNTGAATHLGRIHQEDVGRIVQALQYGTSRLRLPHRGKGFENIIRPTKLHVDNAVLIVSGKGLCLIDHAGMPGGWEYETSFGGTLLRWYIKIPQAELAL